MTEKDKTAEEIVREMLDRAGVPDAESYSASDLVEFANLISENEQLKQKLLTSETPEE